MQLHSLQVYHNAMIICFRKKIRKLKTNTEKMYQIPKTWFGTIKWMQRDVRKSTDI